MNYENIKLIVNGVVLPSPITINYNLEDLDADSERDATTAELHRNRIRSDITKISLTYGMNQANDVSVVLKAISAETLSVELYDVKEGKRVTKTMYAGPKSMQLVLYNGAWIKGLKFNLVEV